MDRRAALGLTLSAPFALAVTSGAGAQADDLYPAARAEGSLTMYTGGASINSTPVVKAFNARYPRINVTVVGAYSNVNDVIIEQQLRDRNVTADIIGFQTVQDFVRWNAAGDILPYKFPGYELFDAHYGDPNGAFMATNLNPLTYLYNTQQVATANWSARHDVPPPAGYRPLSSYHIANEYRAFVVNTELVNSLRAKYFAYTGPVVNH